MPKYDICIVGSGAGAGPIAYELSHAGQKVVVLEKGDWYKREDFSKDELAFNRRDIVTPSLDDEFHIIEENVDGVWQSTPTTLLNWSFFNGNIVGGSSNFMSGFFHRLSKKDIKQKSSYKKIKNSNIEDWPISYDELEYYYDKVDEVVGVTKDTQEHPISALFDKSSLKLGLKPLVTPRAVLSKNTHTRDACYYSNYCGSYGCSSGAKGSSREALLNPALKTGNLTILDNAYVTELITKNKSISKVKYLDKKTNTIKYIKAKIFVVAGQAVETSRLLLNSKNKDYTNGVANSSGQVGKNLLFSAGGIVTGEFKDSKKISLEDLQVEGLFVNRAIKDWYEIDPKTKGGLLEVLFEHANPIRKANLQKRDENGKLIWGTKLYEKLDYAFTKSKTLNFEIFNDWIPHDDCFVSIDEKYKDKYGIPVAKIRIGSHPNNVKVGNILANNSLQILKQMGATNINIDISAYPPQNLQAGGCRFGNDPKTSVLDKNCKAHDVDNLYVADGSFMPTGGSVPYTYTIYANSFRIAQYIKNIII